MTDTTTDDANVVTDARAAMLAAHAIHVQGGFSTAEVERARAEKDIAAGATIDWAAMEAEVNAAMLAKLSAAFDAAEAAEATGPAPTPSDEVDPTEPVTHAQRVDVTAVLASIDQGEALRARIKALTAELKVHEDNIKDVLGPATEGTDKAGNVVIRYPFRNRSGLNRELVKTMLSPDEYAKAVTETNYRTLLYGESDK